MPRRRQPWQGEDVGRLVVRALPPRGSRNYPDGRIVFYATNLLEAEIWSQTANRTRQRTGRRWIERIGQPATAAREGAHDVDG